MNIDALFADIRLLYFPRWDRRRQWAAAFSSANQRHDNTGYCDARAKTIYLDERSIRMMTNAGVRAFLIHEICHDVGGASHSRGWATRMERAARRAEELNEPEVAKILHSDIYSYGCTGSLVDYDRPSVLEYVAELLEGDSSMGCETTVQRVAKYFGHSTTKVRRDFGAVIEDFMSTG